MPNMRGSRRCRLVRVVVVATGAVTVALFTVAIRRRASVMLLLVSTRRDTYAITTRPDRLSRAQREALSARRGIAASTTRR